MYSYGGQFKFNLGYFPNRGGAATRAPRVDILGAETGIYTWVLSTDIFNCIYVHIHVHVHNYSYN